VTLRFDESQLRLELTAAPPSVRLAFAVACAERLFGGYQTFNQHAGKGDVPLVRDTLNKLWTIASLSGAYPDIDDTIVRLEFLLPAEEGDEWTSDFAVAENAIASLIFAAYVAKTGDTNSAMLSARRAYETADYLATLTTNAKSFTAELEASLLASPQVQKELESQQYDIALLAQSTIEDTISQSVEVVRSRAMSF